MHSNIEFEAALALLTRDLTPVEAEPIPLLEAAGRLLAEDVVAGRDQPPFDRSPLDGYALRSADLTGARSGHPVRLKVTGRIYAGQTAGISVGPGEAVRVTTGAMLPPGCDAVVRQEDTDRGADTVSVRRELWPFDNYIRAGEDFRAGDLILGHGKRLWAADIGLLASLGRDEVSVRRRPRVAVIATGEELTEPGTPLAPGHVYDSNRYHLHARLRELGGEPLLFPPCRDTPQALSDLLAQAAEESDLILTTGSASVGEGDVLRDALALSGAQTVFFGVRLRPGGHLLFSRCRNLPVLSLSGNPGAAAATFELFARPVLAALSDCPELLPQYVDATLTCAYPKSSPVRRFLWGVLAGDQVVALPSAQRPGALASLLGCNCLVDVCPGSGPLSAGQRCRALALRL